MPFFFYQTREIYLSFEVTISYVWFIFLSYTSKNFLHRKLVFIGPNVIVYILFKFSFTTLFSILDLKKSIIFFIFIGISAIVCRMFIYIATYTKKKFIALDIYQLLGCALMVILIAYIIIYHVEPHHKELVFLGITFLSEKICVGVPFFYIKQVIYAFTLFLTVYILSKYLINLNGGILLLSALSNKLLFVFSNYPYNICKLNVC